MFEMTFISTKQEIKTEFQSKCYSRLDDLKQKAEMCLKETADAQKP